MSINNEFIGLYPVSKTLRFELKPIGKTLENIQKSEIIKQDEDRKDDCKKVKKLMDEYHKFYIEQSLQKCVLNKETMDEYMEYYKSTDEKAKDKLDKIKEKLRKEIVVLFKGSDKLSKEGFIKDILVNHLTDEKDRELVSKFDGFTTYFTGFNTNRENIYSPEEKSTAVAYRLINENLPKYIANIKTYNQISQILETEIQELKNNIENELFCNIEDLFDIDNYSKFLPQSAIDLYNLVIGGRTQIQGLNEYINLYNQRHRTHYPKFVPLFKQILSDKETLSWLPESFSSDNELLEAIENTYREIKENAIHSCKNILSNISDYDLDGIYIKNDTTLTSILKSYYGDWNIINTALEQKYGEKQSEKVKKNKSYSLSFINDLLGKENKKIEDFYKAYGKKETDKLSLFGEIEEKYSKVQTLLNTEYNGNLRENKHQEIENLKEFLDSLKNLLWFFKSLYGEGDEYNRNMKFYSEYETIFVELNKVTPLYDMVRNYLTKKAYSEEKFKLNFETSTLLNGWDVNKERDNLGVLLRKDGLYYLAIMNKSLNNRGRVFKKEAKNSEECYEKIDYKLLPGPNKMLPKVFFAKGRIKEFNPSEELLTKYEKGTHKKGENFNLQDCRDLIDFFKQSIAKHEDWSQFDFHFSKTESYQNINDFYEEVESQGYKLSFRNISSEYINQLVEDGKIYLFQIYKKDFSPYSKGTPNLHTLYWKALFDEYNLKDVVYKLNGQAEIFYRKKSLPDDEKTMTKGHHYEQLKDKFSYPIIKDRRYRVDKFQFHVPITMNFQAKDNENINIRVRNFIKKGGVKHVIGIDRGERHLLYLTLTDLDGNIKQQFSLNEIINEYKGKTYKVDYHKLLQEKEDSRTDAKKNWQKVENIKELKEGYLSQVINKIVKLVIEYNAIVVLENLNMGFKRSRQKIEKQVYQKFEKMLIDKLNYLVDKQKAYNEEGGLLKAYQLTAKFDSFKKLGNQTGFLFYVPATYTSKIDPVTGFINAISIKYESIEKTKLLLNKFDDIRYNEEKDYFEFVVKDYSKFSAKVEQTRLNWTICTYKDRIELFRNKDKNNSWDNRKINLTEEFKNLFENNNINYYDKLKENILKQEDKSFFERLLYLLKLTLQMRNSVTGTQEDYIISPVVDENGNFFDSRNNIESLPKDADANGAYNIARKGIWVINQIKQSDDIEKTKLAMTDKQWLNFVQK
ncbi:MAG: type V CRISPR-associated protein Cas12a/Cpf1 [Bacteroidales bacterium]|nr:type V CRISPR-associated protein Cas12a/Cpf1 [Bacteroidales bacterium]